MARKKGFDYFAAMEQLATNGHLAAKRFSLLINDYSETALSEAAAEIHGLEKEGDQVIAELTMSCTTHLLPRSIAKTSWSSLSV